MKPGSGYLIGALRKTCVFAVALLGSVTAEAQEFSAEGRVGVAWTDNVYLMRTHEWDASIEPGLRLGADFANYWTVEYDGSAEFYTQHTDLMSHEHSLRLTANPAWGSDGQNELLVSFSIDTMRNQDAYSSLNFVGGRLLSLLSFEPETWFAWKIGLDARFRWFYDDTQSNALDVMPRMEARFTLPSRTTLTPRVAYGFRYNPGLKGKGMGRPDRTDQQMDAGLHISQGLWETGGLQADYGYRHLFAASGVLPHKLTQSQFAFLTSDFLAGGHRAYVRIKQVLPTGFSATAGVDFRTLSYKGWPAADANGNLLGFDREDQRLGPTLSANWSKTAGPIDLVIGMNYSYVRQWSNSIDYDTDSHSVTLDLSVNY